MIYILFLYLQGSERIPGPEDERAATTTSATTTTTTASTTTTTASTTTTAAIFRLRSRFQSTTLGSAPGIFQSLPRTPCRASSPDTRRSTKHVLPCTATNRGQTRRCCHGDGLWRCLRPAAAAFRGWGAGHGARLHGHLRKALGGRRAAAAVGWRGDEPASQADASGVLRVPTRRADASRALRVPPRRLLVGSVAARVGASPRPTVSTDAPCGLRVGSSRYVCGGRVAPLLHCCPGVGVGGWRGRGRGRVAREHCRAAQLRPALPLRCCCCCFFFMVGLSAAGTRARDVGLPHNVVVVVVVVGLRLRSAFVLQLAPAADFGAER